MKRGFSLYETLFFRHQRDRGMVLLFFQELSQWKRILVAADGALLHGEFWMQTQSAPKIIISHRFHFPSVHFRSVAALEYAHGANS
jgi:hypothetical protein